MPSLPLRLMLKGYYGMFGPGKPEIFLLSSAFREPMVLMLHKAEMI